MKHRRLPAWLAGLALLMHLLSMPLAGMLPADAKRLLGWSGHCPAMQAALHRAHALHASAAPAEHDPGSHSGMPPCCCCAGSVGLAALPSAAPSLPQEAGASVISRTEPRSHWPLPRQRWPALNPRASPLA
ncbi:hypothetical protein CXK94_03120 [Stutzerimonas stutzeri]|uniref:DUF2946 domain-containing protein n=1 Tax=Stutzerimonas stutzeri TaxID=316 RepID=A0A2N8T9Z7_STUST|nr:DUF2946 domain-containing protein [Stutzerimonas stutzeri]MCQ4326006.1 DUF2946 domain-containing protein [Stutzerimonas stutzeri]PNG11587.1 hypothetical protein CXK94_03120 [Stutzerimonas stutzeri]